MSLYDIQQRTDAILSKYAQCDAPTNVPRGAKSEDPFNEELDAIDMRIDALIKARGWGTGRGAWKGKQQLLTERVDTLQKKIRKDKGATKIFVEERENRVKTLIEKIYAIPDGMGGNRRAFKIAAFQGGAECRSNVNMSLSSASRLQANPLHYKGSEETERIEQEWEASKKRQDLHLDRIEKGVGSLADMARGMKEELDKQVPIIDDINKQLNTVTTKLKGNNARLKGVVLQLRSRRNFCIDTILAILLLGIVMYIVRLVQKRMS